MLTRCLQFHSEAKLVRVLSCSSLLLLMVIIMDDNIVKPDFKIKSELWKYFGFRSDNTGKIINKKEIICRKCKAVITYCGNTTNMGYHMKRHHKEIDAEDSSSEKPGSSKSTDENVKQLTLGEVAEKTAPFTPGSVKYKQSLLANETISHLKMLISSSSYMKIHRHN